MDRWLQSALDYIPEWIDHQMQLTEQPGCAVAVVHQGKVVLDRVWGWANQPQAERLTTRHRFRVASHSKTFTTVGVLKLVEAGRMRLDDAIGRHVDGLPRKLAEVTIEQLLSHGAGVIRDGTDAGQWSLRRPFLDEAELRADLMQDSAKVLDADTRFKYSNHGYGLLGMAIEAVTSVPYMTWMQREVVDAIGLKHTLPDVPTTADSAGAGVPLAQGHSTKWPLGERVAFDTSMSTNVLASATGFLSTAADLASFMASLSPTARRSVLSPASRRAMLRRRWRDPHATLERWYGLGTIHGQVIPGAGQQPATEWPWFGHSGGFPGTITRTTCVPTRELSVSVLTNASDGLAHVWGDGVLHILRSFALRGAAPARSRQASWTGRWWSLGGAVDLLPVDDGRVLVANPSLPNPMLDAHELEVSSATQARIALSTGFGSHGEGARMERDARGRATAFWLGGTRLLPGGKLATALRRLKP